MKIVTDQTWDNYQAAIRRLREDNNDLRRQVIEGNVVNDRLRADWAGHDCGLEVEASLLRDLDAAQRVAVALEGRCIEQQQRIEYLTREVERLHREAVRRGAA